MADPKSIMDALSKALLTVELPEEAIFEHVVMLVLDKLFNEEKFEEIKRMLTIITTGNERPAAPEEDVLAPAMAGAGRNIDIMLIDAGKRIDFQERAVFRQLSE
eukprot:2667884-Karenia_brevis.AAC.1